MDLNVTETLNHLLVDLFNQITKLERGALAKNKFRDLTISEIHTIEQISYPERPTMSEVATRLCVTLGTLTTSVNRLVKKGYVMRQKSDQDKRVSHLVLTEKGSGVAALHHAYHQQMVQQITAHTTPEEQRILAKSLGSLISFFAETNFNAETVEDKP